jgi:acetyl/propionyl-CoA carboxylase alpha subunit
MEGSEISMFYDPIIIKLNAFVEKREIARLGMLCTLDTYLIEGMVHTFLVFAAFLDFIFCCLNLVRLYFLIISMK